MLPQDSLCILAGVRLGVSPRPFELGPAELGVGVGPFRGLVGHLELDRLAGPAAAGLAAPDRYLLGVDDDSLGRSLLELDQPARHDLQHPLDRHLDGADLGSEQHLGDRQPAPQPLVCARVGRRSMMVAMPAGRLGDRLDGRPGHQQGHR